MTETRDTIAAWAEETFGPAGSDARIWARANEEMAELLRLLTFAAEPDPDQVAEECADVAIVLYRLAAQRDWMIGRPPGPETNFGALFYAARANSRMADLLTWLGGEWTQPHGGAFHLQDVVESLAVTCAKVGRDLRVAIDAKMSRNRRRTWRLDGSGHGYHTSEGASA